MNRVIAALKTAYAWCKTNAGFLLLCALGAWTGAYFYKRKDNQVNTVEAALEVERRTRSIDALREQEKGLQPTDAAKANEVMQVAAEIVKHKKRIVELHTGKPLGELSDDEIKRALDSAGL